MTEFSSFLDTLPDPNFKIGTAGNADASGTAGPGFASVKLSSNQPIMRDRTNSGRLISRNNIYHKWQLDITYNPMTRAEFEPVYAFLLEKQNTMKGFYVSLPQYFRVQNSAFATWLDTQDNRDSIEFSTNYVAGTNVAVISTTQPDPIGDWEEWTRSEQEKPAPGDMFTVNDPADATHTKAYKVTRVEEEGTFNTPLGSVSSNTYRIHFTPGLQKAIPNPPTGINVVFYQPKLRMVQTADVMEYSLNNNNLYSYQLKLEEALL